MPTSESLRKSSKFPLFCAPHAHLPVHYKHTSKILSSSNSAFIKDNPWVKSPLRTTFSWEKIRGQYPVPGGKGGPVKIKAGGGMLL